VDLAPRNARVGPLIEAVPGASAGRSVCVVSSVRSAPTSNQ
jgi:hypothetical protein